MDFLIIKKYSETQFYTVKYTQIMKKQQAMTRNGKEYKTLNAKIRNKCRQAREVWLSEKCMEIESISNIVKAIIHKRINMINDVLINRLYKVRGGNTDNKKRKNIP